MEKRSKVYAIVVCFNGSKWIEKCFGSLINSACPLKVIAVDNGSTDGTPIKIKEKFPNIEVIEASENLGFGKANNVGMEKAIKEEADFVFLLNQDAWIEPDTVEKLVNISSKNKEFGILSPIHVNGSGDGLDYNFSMYLAPHRTPNFYSDLFFGKLDQYYISNYVNAAAWLITSSCLNEVGVFNPMFKQYAEDNEYIDRLHSAGLKIAIITKAIIYHDRNQGVGNSNMQESYRLYNQAILNISKRKSKPESKIFLVRKIIGYYLLNVLVFYGRNQKLKDEVKLNYLMLKLSKGIMHKKSIRHD